MSSIHIDKISLSTFNATLSRYADTAPSTLADLDELRYTTIPARLAKIEKNAQLSKSDVEKLVEWKLKHGTFRPALMGLVKSNPADLVKSTTTEAFAAYAESSDAMGALKVLTKLRGIGPATASLLLNVFVPAEVPFFSDELFRWTHWDGKGQTGWGRSIKYNVTEYKELLASVEALRKRLDVSAVDAEKVAYVLGKENVDIDTEIKGGDGEAGDEEVRDKIVGKKTKEDTRGRKIAKDSAQAVPDVDSEETKDDALTGLSKEHDKRRKDTNSKTNDMERKPGLLKEKEKVSKADVKEVGKKGTKRKAQEKAPAEGTRKSTRRKA